MSVRGKVIVFDGPDGVGKTTQLELTAEWLRQSGHDVHTTRASGGTPIGELLRDVSLSDTPRPAEVDVYISLAMHTAVADDLENRRKKQIVLVDRSPMAVIAYNVFGNRLKDTTFGYDAFETLITLWHPDLCVYIDVPQHIADERRARRNGNQKPTDYFEKQNHAFHDRVRTGYQKALTLLEQHTEWYGRLEEIDGTPDEQTVQNAIRQVVKKVL